MSFNRIKADMNPGEVAEPSEKTPGCHYFCNDNNPLSAKKEN
jgi:hypothetical protein